MRYKKLTLEFSQDPVLQKLIQDVGPFKIRFIKNPFEAIVDSVITQQISDAAGMIIAKKFRNVFGGKFPTAQDIIQTNNDKLLSSGITNSKANCIKEISNKVLTGQLSFKKFTKMYDEDIISELITIKGVGRWTAEMFLIFGLKRLDILPLGDLGLKRGIQKMYSLSDVPTTEKILQISNVWRPYRTIATWYIWKGIQNFQNV